MRAAFLDRDGVINRDKAYVHRWEDFEFVPGAIEAMARLRRAGYVLVVVTNQSGIARGKYSEAQFRLLTEQMLRELLVHGVDVAAVYHCPHHPDGRELAYRVDCDCRKPAPGMLLQAKMELGLDMSASILVGDKSSDLEAARRAGVARAYLVLSDNEESDGAVGVAADGIFPDLACCVQALLGGKE